MLKIRINHTHLSQIKKTKRKNHKKQRKVKTYKPRNVALNKKTKRWFYCKHVVHEQKFTSKGDRAKEIIVYYCTNERAYRYPKTIISA